MYIYNVLYAHYRKLLCVVSAQTNKVDWIAVTLHLTLHLHVYHSADFLCPLKKTHSPQQMLDYPPTLCVSYNHVHVVLRFFSREYTKSIWRRTNHTQRSDFQKFLRTTQRFVNVFPQPDSEDMFFSNNAIPLKITENWGKFTVILRLHDMTFSFSRLI